MTVVADSSAVLAYLLDEPADLDLELALAGATISTVNVSEVAMKLLVNGATRATIDTLLVQLKLVVVPLDSATALDAAELELSARSKGLSLGDRCCLALAAKLGLPALTGDRAWADLGAAAGCEIVLIR